MVLKDVVGIGGAFKYQLNTVDLWKKFKPFIVLISSYIHNFFFFGGGGAGGGGLFRYTLSYYLKNSAPTPTLPTDFLLIKNVLN